MDSQPKPPVPPLLVFGFGILAVSTASILIRFAQRDAPSMVIAAYRLGVATLILAPFGVKRSIVELRSLQPKQIIGLLFSGIFLAIHFAVWITSLEYTSITSSVVLVTTTPLWVALLSPLFLKEKLHREVWLGLVLAMLGGAIVAFHDACTIGTAGISCEPFQGFLGGKALIGNVLALIGAFSAAGYMILGRSIRPKFSLVSYTFVVYGISAVVLFGLVSIGRYSLVDYPAQTFVWFLLLGIIPQVLGHSSFNWALKYVPAAFVSLALIGEPVGATILAVIILREAPNAMEIVGGVMILAGIYLASRASSTVTKSQKSAEDLIRT